MTNFERHRYVLPGDNGVIDKGIQQLWTQPADVQAAVISEAMTRWDQNMPAADNLHNLGLDYRAEILARPSDEYPSSNMNKRDIITAVLLGNIELYPWDPIKKLGLDSMDCGTWDGVNGLPGDHWQEKEKVGIAVVNPGKKENVRDIWKGPDPIRRASSWVEDEQNDGDFTDILKEVDPDDGIVIMKPGRFYLLNILPAVKLNGIRVDLATRSGVARWGLNGMINSDKVHAHHNGLLTAEAIVFSNRPFVFDTAWYPWQMYFQYSPIVPEELSVNGSTSFIHTGDVRKTLKQAIEEFTPEMMLPSEIKPERRIRLS